MNIEQEIEIAQYLIRCMYRTEDFITEMYCIDIEQYYENKETLFEKHENYYDPEDRERKYYHVNIMSILDFAISNSDSANSLSALKRKLSPLSFSISGNKAVVTNPIVAYLTLRDNLLEHIKRLNLNVKLDKELPVNDELKTQRIDKI
jgi:hypothetical protein